MSEPQALRTGEVGEVPLRSGRYFKLHNYWFFTTREGRSVGPFDSMDCAKKSVRDYIEFINIAGPEVTEFFKVGLREAS
ncbi:MAG: DUF6316 family protein [bacterium]